MPAPSENGNGRNGHTGTPSVDKTTYFHLNTDPAAKQSPYHPALTDAIRGHLGTSVNQVAFNHLRATSQDLLIGLPKDHKSSNAIVVESLAIRMGTNFLDLPRQIHVLTADRYGVEGEIFVVLPYIEGRDDKRFRDDTTNMLDLYVANMVAAAREKDISALAVWDPHSPTVVKALEHLYNGDKEGLTVIPLTAARLFAQRFKQEGLVDENTIVVSPDVGSLARSRILADELGTELILTEKSRPEVNEVEIENFYRVDREGKLIRVPDGYLKGKTAIEVDDMIDTGGTAAKGAKELKEKQGVVRVIFAATHGIFSKGVIKDGPREGEMGQAMEDALQRGIIDRLFIADTLPSYTDVAGAEIVSVAGATAALIKHAAGIELTEVEQQLLEACVYNPGQEKPEKKDLERQIANRKLEWLGERHNGKDKIPSRAVIFQRPQAIVAEIVSPNVQGVSGDRQEAYALVN